ncbi:MULTISPECIES: aspartate-alanine antiporter [unclassified Chelatococcus]|uniref:aspartate-alanine antiporter n=1 Tax=unclassified Chelatococcus TaxID=2638111 RepID=UPI001BCDE892|nr:MULTISPECIES: aspartate-alanine antiporter [unclassified Chelatococcus]CAH1668930.1 putative transport protein [Hyphomicrobiales bacterium]MBS7738140.1 aspartate-alanine antiporter [Chelatococcus sp. HY11]MBX3546913.1 aspartate-alanine antiporter [Chelatococcus sp.]MCO5077514.1 aspartate-alanine antiporter [Chelatococcus sp.]CAH1678852.1 putative transport protein [Hyphomicrobiales bacterium]
MWQWFVDVLRAHPAIAVFLSLAIGYAVGKLSYKGIGLGAVTGTLLTALVVGQLDIVISNDVRSIFFLIFLFAIGYSVGPQFVQGVAKNGLPQAAFTIVVCVLCLGVAWLCARIAGYNVGFAAGLFAGSNTISSALALSVDAIEQIGKPPEETNALVNAVPTAFAMTYIFGTIGATLIIALLGPKLLGINLVEACKAYEIKMGARANHGGHSSAWHQFIARSYRILPDSSFIGQTALRVEASYRHKQFFVERLRRDNAIFDVKADTVLQAGDVIAVAGERGDILQQLGHSLEEVEDRELLDVRIEGVDVLLTNRHFDGKTLSELAKLPVTRGIFLRRIRRGATGVDIPILPATELHRGDVLTVYGRPQDISAAVSTFGRADRSSDETDIGFVAGAIVIGALVGTLVWHIGSVPITLSSSGGVLIAGIVAGWLRAVHPTFGNVPPAAGWLMNSLGLNMFIATVGLSSGPSFVAGAEQLGASLFLWGMVATAVPLILSLYIGRYLFRFDDAILLGCCAGARASTATLGMLTERAGSQVPALGFTVTCAVGNTLLTIGGIIIVMLMR